MGRELHSLGMMVIDAVMLAIIPFIAFFLRFESFFAGNYFNNLVQCLPVIVIVELIMLYVFRVYRRLWRYAGVDELLAIITAFLTSGLILYIMDAIFMVMEPRSIHLLNTSLAIAAVSGMRFIVRMVQNRHKQVPQEIVKVLIVGAGNIGAAIVREIRAYCNEQKKIVGFIDDEPKKRKQFLNGIPVIGNRDDIDRIVKEQGVQEIIIAIPSASGVVVREIVRICRETKCDIRIVPSIREVMDGRVTMRQLRNVDLNDLLGREAVKLDTTLMSACLKNKRVLVTGAGGSIGSEICRQVAKLSPSELILLGKSENNIYEIEQEMKRTHPHVHIKPVIADVGNEKRMNDVFTENRPQVVFHAAAHKHVPLMEDHPVEAVRNNIFGTKYVAETSVKFGVERFVMISTDKAVNPTSVMGASKRAAEMVVCSMNGKGTTKFAAVRFGNVLGSRGSVVPLFRRQIARGGPITITDPEMVRYFMTIPEAAQLVLQAGAMAQGGEVFVLDMGKPVKIYDLACGLIKLTGLKPHEDIKIEFSGLRPGEKLYEELLSDDEGQSSTKHEKIFVANLKANDEKKLLAGLAELRKDGTPEEIINRIANLVPTYQRKNIGSTTNIKQDVTEVASSLEDDKCYDKVIPSTNS